MGRTASPSDAESWVRQIEPSGLALKQSSASECIGESVRRLYSGETNAHTLAHTALALSLVWLTPPARLLGS